MKNALPQIDQNQIQKNNKIIQAHVDFHDASAKKKPQHDSPKRQGVFRRPSQQPRSPLITPDAVSELLREHASNAGKAIGKSNVLSPLSTKQHRDGGGFGLTGLENQTLLANLTLSHNMAQQVSTSLNQNVLSQQ